MEQLNDEFTGAELANFNCTSIFERTEHTEALCGFAASVLRQAWSSCWRSLRMCSICLAHLVPYLWHAGDLLSVKADVECKLG